MPWLHWPPSTPSTLSDTHPTPGWTLAFASASCFALLIYCPACRGCVCEAASEQTLSYRPSLPVFLFNLPSLSSISSLSLSLKHSLSCLTFSIIFIISSQRAHFLNFTAAHFVCVCQCLCECVSVLPAGCPLVQIEKRSQAVSCPAPSHALSSCVSLSMPQPTLQCTFGNWTAVEIYATLFCIPCNQ